MLARFAEELRKDLPALFTHAPDFIYQVPKGLSGVPEILITTPSDRFASAHRWYRETESLWPIFTNATDAE